MDARRLPPIMESEGTGEHQLAGMSGGARLHVKQA